MKRHDVFYPRDGRVRRVNNTRVFYIVGQEDDGDVRRVYISPENRIQQRTAAWYFCFFFCRFPIPEVCGVPDVRPCRPHRESDV